MDLHWTPNPAIFKTGDHKQVLLDNFTLPGIDVNFQGAIFFQGDTFSFGLRYSDDQLKANEPWLYREGLVVHLRYIVRNHEKVMKDETCIQQRIKGDTLFGMNWMPVRDILWTEKEQKLILTLHVRYPDGFAGRLFQHKLSSDLEALILSGLGLDLTIRSATANFKAHRLILSARCPAYRNLTFWKTDLSVPLDWNRFSAASVAFVLHYIYTNQLLTSACLKLEEHLEAIALCNELQLFLLAFSLANGITNDDKRDSKQVQDLGKMLAASDPIGLSPPSQIAQHLIAIPPPAVIPPTIAASPPPTYSFWCTRCCCPC